jgi:hypothetical protein
MSFEAKKLRVQLPCGENGSVIEAQAGGGGEGGGGGCDWPSGCQVFTCAWGTDCINVFWTTPLQGPVLCQWISACDWGFGTCPADTCPNASCTFPSPCRFHTCIGTCPVHSIVATGTIREGGLIVDADQLPALRERLEAQLKEIENAERAVEERRREQEK